MEADEKQEKKDIEVEEWLKNKVIRQEKVLIRDNDNDTPRIIPYACAVELENLFEFYTDQTTDELYIYHEDKGIWKPDGETIINKIVETQLGYIASTRGISEVIGHIKRHNYIDPDKLNVEKSLINLKNGVLDLETDQLLPHDNNFYFTDYVNVKWNSEPKIPQKIIDFLLDRAEAKDEKFINLLEALAFPLVPDYRIHAAIMLVGETHRGKTTFLELLQRIYGEENASHLTMQQFSKAAQEHSFILNSLADKTINIADDLPARPITDVGYFKQLTGESPILAEIKFSNKTRSFVNRAKMFFSANKIPIAYENTDAFYSRWLIIEFNKPIENEIPNFVNELTSEDELSNLLPFLVWIARNKLMKSTKFTFNKTAEQNANIYAKHSNTAKLYCETRLKVNPEGSILKSVLFEDYKKWCEKHNYLEESEHSFWHTLKTTFADQENVAERRKTTDGTIKRFYLGLEFASEDEEVEEEEETETNQDKDLLREYFEIDKIEKNDKPDPIQIYIKEIYDYIMSFKNLIK